MLLASADAASDVLVIFVEVSPLSVGVIMIVAMALVAAVNVAAGVFVIDGDGDVVTTVGAALLCLPPCKESKGALPLLLPGSISFKADHSPRTAILLVASLVLASARPPSSPSKQATANAHTYYL